jgi:trehalose 6-phosphate synthase
MAGVGLVTPLRDGMNLVAKEYVAAQDAEDPGVLVLSQFAGAAEELESAILVNPHEPEAMAAAIKSALDMPLAERQERHKCMFDHLATNTIHRWAERFLSTLAEPRQRGKILGGLRQRFAARG